MAIISIVLIVIVNGQLGGTLDHLAAFLAFAIAYWAEVSAVDMFVFLRGKRTFLAYLLDGCIQNIQRLWLWLKHKNIIICKIAHMMA